VRRRNQVAHRRGAHIIGSIAGGEGVSRIDGATGQCTIGAAAEIRLQIRALWSVGGLFALFQSPLLFGRINEPQVVDAGILLRRGACPNEVGNGNGRKHADDSHNDHNLHEGEAELFILCFHLGSVQRHALKKDFSTTYLEQTLPASWEYRFKKNAFRHTPFFPHSVPPALQINFRAITDL
jgi:hypothetical protein